MVHWRTRGEEFGESNNLHNNEPGTIDNEYTQSTPYHGEKDDLDLNFTKNETIDIDGARLYLLCGHIKELENGGNDQSKFHARQKQQRQREEATQEEPARQEEDVCVVWNHVPEEITLHRTASSISYKFAMAVDTQAVNVRQEMMDGKVYMIHSLSRWMLRLSRRIFMKLSCWFCFRKLFILLFNYARFVSLRLGWRLAVDVP